MADDLDVEEMLEAAYNKPDHEVWSAITGRVCVCMCGALMLQRSKAISIYINNHMYCNRLN